MSQPSSRSLLLRKLLSLNNVERCLREPLSHKKVRRPVFEVCVRVSNFLNEILYFVTLT